MTYDDALQLFYTLLRDQRVAKGVIGFVATLLILSAAQTVFIFLPYQRAIPSGTDSRLIAPEQALPDIAEWHLFGDYEAALAALPLTQLQLTLEGVFIGSSDSQSQALIAAAGGSPVLYKVGDRLPVGVTIHQILQDSIVLEHNGKLEALPLPIPELQFGPRPQDVE